MITKHLPAYMGSDQANQSPSEPAISDMLNDILKDNPGVDKKIDIMKAEIQNIIQRLESGMLDFMKEGDAPYEKEQVDKCIRIIKSSQQYVARMSQCSIGFARKD